jgi:hypothetical protein
MTQLAVLVAYMAMAASIAICWYAPLIIPDHQPLPYKSRRRSPRRRPDTPDLVVPPGRRSKSMTDALKRVQQAAPEAVQRDQGGGRRFALVPRVREEISAVLADTSLAEAEAQELQRASKARSTIVLGMYPPYRARNMNALENLILKCAAAVIPASARWQHEWAAEYAAMAHYPARRRIRFLAGLLIAAPRLAWSLRRR